MSASSDILCHQTHMLYDKHHDWLLQWIYRRTDKRHSVQDVAHDVFLRLLLKDSLPDLPQPRAYLAKIAHGLLIDQHRRELIEKTWLEAQLTLPQDDALTALTTEEQYELIETLARVDALLGGLKPRCRQVFLMSRIEELSYPRIAEQLGVSLSTVEKDIARALRHCYQLMLG